MSVRWHQMKCPAELLEAGDHIARNPAGPWARVRTTQVGGPVVTLYVEIDHGNGVELETWRPRLGTDIELRYPLTGQPARVPAPAAFTAEQLRRFSRYPELKLVTQ